MTTGITAWSGALLALSLSALPATAQTACRPADQRSARLVQWVKNIATGTSAQAFEQRAQTKIPAVSASQVTYVTSKTVCNKALTAYNAETVMQQTATGATVQPSGQLYVVQAGNVYVVWDPVKSAGSYAVYVVLDSRYRVLWSGLA